VPAFGEVGIKTIYNGAIPFTPDGVPIVGPAPGLYNYWLSEGHTFGITAAGGAGWQLAEWIVTGEPNIDMTSLDPRRFGDYASHKWVQLKCEEVSENIFTIHYPDGIVLIFILKINIEMRFITRGGDKSLDALVRFILIF